MVPAIATLVVGLIVGYLAQRSRMCFIGGLRDFILVRDTELLKGVGAFFITAWLAFSLAGYIGLLDLQAPQYQGISPNLLQRATTDEATNANVAGHAAPPPVRRSQGLLTSGWPIWLLAVGWQTAVRPGNTCWQPRECRMPCFTWLGFTWESSFII
jgi:hypothetical protein